MLKSRVKISMCGLKVILAWQEAAGAPPNASYLYYTQGLPTAAAVEIVLKSPIHGIVDMATGLLLTSQTCFAPSPPISSLLSLSRPNESISSINPILAVSPKSKFVKALTRWTLRNLQSSHNFLVYLSSANYFADVLYSLGVEMTLYSHSLRIRSLLLT